MSWLARVFIIKIYTRGYDALSMQKPHAKLEVLNLTSGRYRYAAAIQINRYGVWCDSARW